MPSQWSEGVSQPVSCQIEQCQTARRTLAQTETLLPLTGTDGVSHAYCVEGYVTSLQRPCCLLNLIRSSEVQKQIHICTSRHMDKNLKKGRCWMNFFFFFLWWNNRFGTFSMNSVIKVWVKAERVYLLLNSFTAVYAPFSVTSGFSN